jgi:putative glutamine amidotransferase
MKPIIGITCGQLTSEAGVARCYQNMSYAEAVVAAGGAPFLVPLLSDLEAVRALYDLLDGLLLTGGGDVDPQRYGLVPHENLGPTDPLRDEVELALARWAYGDNLPTLGICRGIQTLNVALGGTLIQDIPTQVANALIHPYQTGNPRDMIAHTVSIELGSLLDALLPTPDRLVAVNSMHHQAVDEVAPGFVVSARAPDGIIEAIEDSSKRYALGIQWHPEEMVERYAGMRPLFEQLVAAAQG